MLRSVNWAVRVAALVFAGVVAFSTRPGSTGQLAVEIAAFAVAALGMGLWALIDRSAAARARYAGLLPLVLVAIAVTCGVAALTHNGGIFIGMSFMATIAAGSDMSLVAAWAVTGAAVLATGTVGLAFGAGTWQVFGDVLFILVGLLLGFNRRGYRVQADQSAALLAKAEQLRLEHGRAAALDERNRIAREVHDVLAHSLGALGVQIQAARAVLTDRQDVGLAVELLDQAQRMASDGLNETRRAVHALRADTPPLPELLADLSAAHRLRHHAPVNFQVTGVPRPVSPDAGLALTRAAQEALVNAAKHAPHQSVEVRLDYSEGRTALVVANGLGDHTERQRATLETMNGGHGLAGMRERLLLIDGSLSVGPDDGNWVVSAQVPQ